MQIQALSLETEVKSLKNSSFFSHNLFFRYFVMSDVSNRCSDSYRMNLFILACYEETCYSDQVEVGERKPFEWFFKILIHYVDS